MNRHLTEGNYGRPEEGGLQAEGASEAEALRGARWVCVSWEWGQQLPEQRKPGRRGERPPNNDMTEYQEFRDCENLDIFLG